MVCVFICYNYNYKTLKCFYIKMSFLLEDFELGVLTLVGQLETIFLTMM